MRGRIASRAHSFKENILEALGSRTLSGNDQSSSSSSPSSSSLLMKKRVSGSSDNILDYSASKNAEVLVREVQLSLRYFEDAVAKGTFEILPGCASIVLETILAIQSHINAFHSRENFTSKLQKIYGSVAKLTQWADGWMIVGKANNPFDNDLENIIQPLQKNVLTLANQLLVLNTPELKNSSSFHNSLPDITSISENTQDSLSKSSHSSPPPSLPTRQRNKPPPLPPKMNHQRISNDGSTSNSIFPIDSTDSLLYIDSDSSHSTIDLSKDSFENENDFLTVDRSHRKSSVSSFDSLRQRHSESHPPPLPPKKRHIMSYMEIFGRQNLCSSTSSSDLLKVVWHQNYHDFDILASFTSPIDYLVHADELYSTPPALPPKKNRAIPIEKVLKTERIIPIIRENVPYFKLENDLSNSSSFIGEDKNQGKSEIEEDSSLLEIFDVTQMNYLLCYNESEVRAGTVNALVILATQSLKNDFLFQEAFLTTYRTFLSAIGLLSKLVQRFRHFKKIPETNYQRAARSSFSLLVRVVNGLADCDFQDEDVMELLTEFMTELVSDGELILGRALRSKFIEKYEQFRAKSQPELDLSNLSLLGCKQHNLLNFKSMDLAEQMTYLDSKLFHRLDAVELILWVQEQNEDKSPNLTKFTEHFNNMSFWTRTQILQQEESNDRVKYILKFMKIMKYLRKHNNFNSYLAILSALDSAPIRRLDWQRSITEGLKDFCTLIDSSSSFRAYRQALNESGSPCIPYVGLILQDLTFVHIGNSDNCDNKVNFGKRWQQFNILDNLRRYKKENYSFYRRDDIIHLFGNFSDYMSEDALWHLSESIKPRGGHQKLGK